MGGHVNSLFFLSNMKVVISRYQLVSGKVVVGSSMCDLDSWYALQFQVFAILRPNIIEVTLGMLELTTDSEKQNSGNS